MVLKTLKDSKPTMMKKPLKPPLKNLKEKDLILYLSIPINALIFVATLILNFMAGSPEYSFGLFKNGISKVSRMFEVNISPTGATFAIWSVIYLLQIASVLYGLSLMLRLTPNGFAYANPPILSRTFYSFSSLGNALNITWLFVWDNILILPALFVLAGIAASIIFATAIVVIRQRRFRDQLLEEERTFDISILSNVVANGGAIYGTWALVATHISLAINLVYIDPISIDNEIASLISLFILILLTLVYTGLDIFLFGRLTRSLLAPYATVAWAATGIATNDFDPARSSSLIALFLALFSFFGLLFKIVKLVLFPRFKSGEKKKSQELPNNKIGLF